MPSIDPGTGTGMHRSDCGDHTAHFGAWLFSTTSIAPGTSVSQSSGAGTATCQCMKIWLKHNANDIGRAQFQTSHESKAILMTALCTHSMWRNVRCTGMPVPTSAAAIWSTEAARRNAQNTQLLLEAVLLLAVTSLAQVLLAIVCWCARWPQVG
eukprot:4917420-Amphidinium_carterae.1